MAEQFKLAETITIDSHMPHTCHNTVAVGGISQTISVRRASSDRSSGGLDRTKPAQEQCLNIEFSRLEARNDLSPGAILAIILGPGPPQKGGKNKMNFVN